MKILYFALLATVLLGAQCKKPKGEYPIDLLPPETQTGANTFGCLVNGKAFVPRGPSLSPILFCYYQYIVDNSSNGYYLGLAAKDNKNPEDVISVGIYTDSLALSEGTHLLGDNKKGNYFGKFVQVNSQGSKILYTSSRLPGSIVITKYDPVKHILSGRFSFTVIADSGDSIRVTDGRFDVRYTR
jgi:hypothetical protein